MVTASGSDTVRKSSVKRKSCYDDFGPASASVTAKPDPGKKQKQTQLQLQGTQQEEAEVEAAQVESQEDGDGDQDEIPIVVSAVGKPGPRYSNRKKRQAYVILIHTFNPESISEVTVGQAFHSLEKANEAVAELFHRVKPEYTDVVIDIGTASAFVDGEDDAYPVVRRRITPSGRVAYLWHTEEGRGELSVHKIVIE